MWLRQGYLFLISNNIEIEKKIIVKNNLITTFWKSSAGSFCLHYVSGQKALNKNSLWKRSFTEYSKYLNTGHLNTENIWVQDFLCLTLRWSPLMHYLNTRLFFILTSHDQKTNLFRLVFRSMQVLTTITQHLNNGLVWYLSVHCIRMYCTWMDANVTWKAKSLVVFRILPENEKDNH